MIHCSKDRSDSVGMITVLFQPSDASYVMQQKNTFGHFS
jgi:hypothetical protein